MTGRRVRHAILVVAAVAAAAIWIRLALRPSSDLLNHRELGRRFAVGAPLYAGGLDYPYLPTWAAAHVPLAALPGSIVSAVVFPIGLASLIALLWMLDRVSGVERLDPATRFWVAAAAVALASRFLIRDLLDGGENLIVAALTWSSLYAWTRSRAWIAAVCLGAAISLKLTAGVFLIAFLARRARTQLARTVACAAAFIVLPAVWMGPDAYADTLRVWGSGVWAGVASGDPSRGVLGPEPIGNLALRPALGRLLVGAGASASWRAGSAVAAAAILAALIVGVAVAIHVRRARTNVDRTVDWAAAGVLGLLASPITWRAHLVAVLPACYVLIRRWAEDRVARPWTVAALAAVAVPGILLARGVWGDAVSTWSDVRSLTTWALVVLLAGVVLLRPSALTSSVRP